MEARSTALSMASVQPELKRRPHAIFLAKALRVDPDARKVSCLDDGESTFDVDYDILAIATGSQARLTSSTRHPALWEPRFAMCVYRPEKDSLSNFHEVLGCAPEAGQGICHLCRSPA